MPNEISPHVAEALKTTLGITSPGEVPVATVARGLVDPNGNVVMYPTTSGMSGTAGTAVVIDAVASTITNGTNGRVLFDNNGVVGEKAVTGTGNVVLQTTPTLTTPVIGVATGTSLAVTGLITSSGTAGIGYATGAGGAVTQITSRATGVTLSKICGAITTDSTSLAAGAEATFTVTNTLVAATDIVVVSLKTASGTGLSIPIVTAVAAGSFDITLTNLHASTADTVASVINFAVIKGVAA